MNVICELARKKPKNYLPLAPELFKILTTSRNNWMLIKVVKLLGALVEEEPRLARKLIEPLANHIQTTPAKSLMYECIYAVRASPRMIKFTAQSCIGDNRAWVNHSLNLHRIAPYPSLVAGAHLGATPDAVVVCWWCVCHRHAVSSIHEVVCSRFVGVYGVSSHCYGRRPVMVVCC